MKFFLLGICIIVCILIIIVLVMFLYHSNGRNEVQRKNAQLKKDVANRINYTVHLGEDTFVLDNQDKLLVYQKSAQKPEKFLPPQVIGLPTNGGDFISIIPFAGLPAEGCYNYLTLRKNSYNSKFITHDAPLLVYRSEKDDRYYMQVNSCNHNASRFQGKVIEGEIALDEVLTRDPSHAKLFELCGSPLAFVLLPGDEPETEPQKADLNNIETEPPKRSMGDKIQYLFQHGVDAAPKKQSRRPTFKN